MEHGTCMCIKCKFCFVHLQVNHAKAPLSTVCADSALQSRRHVLACTRLRVVVKPGVNRHFIRRSRAPSVFPACTVFRPDSQFDPFVTSQISFKCLHSTSLKLLAATSHLVEEIKCFSRHERIQIKIETDMRAKIKQTRQTPTSLAHLRPCRHFDLLTNLPVNHKSPSNASCVIGYQKRNQLRLNCFA